MALSILVGVAADVKDEGIKRNHLDDVKRIVQRHERSHKMAKIPEVDIKTKLRMAVDSNETVAYQPKKVSLEGGLLYVLKR